MIPWESKHVAMQPAIYYTELGLLMCFHCYFSCTLQQNRMTQNKIKTVAKTSKIG
jgi:hypothetical protein